MNTEAHFKKIERFKKYASPDAIKWDFGLAHFFSIFVSLFFICATSFGLNYKYIIIVLIFSIVVYFLASFQGGCYRYLQRKETKQFIAELHKRKIVYFERHEFNIKYEFNTEGRLDRLLIFDGYLIESVSETINYDPKNNQKTSETYSLFLEKHKNLLILIRTTDYPSGQKKVIFNTLEEIRTTLSCNSIEKKLYESAGIPHMVYFQP